MPIMPIRPDRGRSGRPAGVVLAAGAGTRLLPLTELRPKALCPVGGVALLDRALARLAPSTGEGRDHLAVNAHHHADQVAAHLAGRTHLSVETPEALGTAGALGALRDWIGGRDVLLTNADAYLPAGLRLDGGDGPFTAGWDGERCRLACLPAGTRRADFTLPDGTGVRYVGVCLLPWSAVQALEPTPSGLYEVLWRRAAERGLLDLQLVAGPCLDCGTVADYLHANLLASGGRSVVGDGAKVAGRLTRSVVWDGAHVGPDEHLVDVVRATAADGTVLTVGATAST
jgi:NDP-sugar pyrophosphorylase family protein